MMNRRRIQNVLLSGLMLMVLGIGVSAAAGEYDEPKQSDVLPPLPHVQLKIKEQVFDVEVTNTRQSMLRGLMFRDALAADKGMLFKFKHPTFE